MRERAADECGDSASEFFIEEAEEDALDFHAFAPPEGPAEQLLRPPAKLPPRGPGRGAGAGGAAPAPVEVLGLPLAVREILQHRRTEDLKYEVDDCAAEAYGMPTLALAAASALGAGRLPPEVDTEKMRLFCSSVQLLKERAKRGVDFGHRLEALTFVNLQGFDLRGLVERRRHNPGPMQMIYMFYSRIYEKLVGKQRGVEVNLFAPIDLEARNLGFRAILDFTSDFKLFPAKVGRRELERIYCTAHPGPMPPLERFASKINYAEFVRMVGMIDCGGEPMDRSRLDGSQTRCNESRVERTKRLAQFMSLTSSKKVKALLHDAYRDTHFWRLADGADFEKEARAAEMRSRPQWNVLPVRPLKPADQAKENAACKYLAEKFTWLKTDQLWEEYEAPFLDMGTLVVGGSSSHFRLTLTNRGLALARLRLEVASGGPLRLPWRDTQLGPGQSIEVPVEFVPLDCGEWCGEILVTACWVGGSAEVKEVVQIPTYMRVLHPHPGASDIAAQLPVNVARPFRPGSSCRLMLDPSPLHNRQLRTPTPCGSRCASLATTAATTPATTAQATPAGGMSGRAMSSGRSGSRPPRASSICSGSGRLSRPSSGGLRGVQLAMEMQRERAASACATVGQPLERPPLDVASRPHSAPFDSPNVRGGSARGTPQRQPFRASVAGGGGGDHTARSSTSAWNGSSLGGASSARPVSASRRSLSAGRPLSAGGTAAVARGFSSEPLQR